VIQIENEINQLALDPDRPSAQSGWGDFIFFNSTFALNKYQFYGSL